MHIAESRTKVCQPLPLLDTLYVRADCAEKLDGKVGGYRWNGGTGRRVVAGARRTSTTSARSATVLAVQDLAEGGPEVGV